MFQKMIADWVKPKSLATYKRQVSRLATLTLCLGICFLVLSLVIDLKSYNRGFLVGLAIGLLLLSASNWYCILDEKRLKANYIKTYDERHRLVTRLAANGTLIVSFSLLILFICLNAFMGLVISFRSILIGGLYVLLITFLGLKWCLGRLI
ncbi:DNA-binding protein [Streptococcus ictaluri]|uniref:Uncharacterized protein n=1 Tax=Streptococcus ictaluri 707-05 TaxID=764299 RepID=G5K4L7_9STRE|nr:hypothetical protein [Streptococcus ictaluri]EHI69073.1 hypothetical protein STRIC_1754 [Streptococcus ictaluri 707-05]